MRVVVIAVVVCGLDIVTSHLPGIDLGPLNRVVAHLNDRTRAEIIGGLFAFFGTVPPLILTLITFAATGLSPYGNSPLILLYRWHRIRRWERLFLFFGRTNLFYRALVLGLALVVALALLQGSRAAGLSNNGLPALAVVLVLAAFLSTSLLALVLWVISLSRPSDVIQYTFLMGCDLLRHLERIKNGEGKLTPRRQTDGSKQASCYEEQEEMRRCVSALTETVSRALEARQRLAAREATRALRRLDNMAQRCALPQGWEQLGSPPGPRPDWLQALFLDAMESIVAAAADLHYYSVGRLGARSLTAIGKRVADPNANWPGRIRLMERTLEAFVNTIDECVANQELELCGLLLRGLRRVVRRSVSNPRLFKRAVRGKLGPLMVEMLTRSVITNDIPSLRASLGYLRELCDPPATDVIPDVTTAIFCLGAIALGSRLYPAAAVLVDQAALRFDPDGTRVAAIVRPWPPDPRYRPPAVPPYVTRDYFQLFLLVAMTRSLAIHNPGWNGEAVVISRQFAQGLSDATERTMSIALTICAVASYPQTQVNDWKSQVNNLDSSLAGAAPGPPLR
jgi:hypothetical protein